MGKMQESKTDHVDLDTAIRTILEGTASETGERFFAALVRNLCRALDTQQAVRRGDTCEHPIVTSRRSVHRPLVSARPTQRGMEGSLAAESSAARGRR